MVDESERGEEFRKSPVTDDGTGDGGKHENDARGCKGRSGIRNAEGEER